MGQPLMYQVNIFIPCMLLSGAFNTNGILIEKDTSNSTASKLQDFPRYHNHWLLLTARPRISVLCKSIARYKCLY